MDRQQADATPAQEWHRSLNSTCNRLSTQYLNLIRSAATRNDRNDPRAGPGRMNSLSDPPPPPLAADVGLSTLQCQLAGENICAAASQLLDITRTLRLSILLMDDDTVAAEEEMQVAETKAKTAKASEEAAALEQQYLEVLQERMGG